MPNEIITPEHVAYGDLEINNKLDSGSERDELMKISELPSSYEKNKLLFLFLDNYNYLPSKKQNGEFVAIRQVNSSQEYRKFARNGHCIKADTNSFSIELSGCHHVETRDFLKQYPIFLKKNEKDIYFVSTGRNGIDPKQLESLFLMLKNASLQDRVVVPVTNVNSTNVVKIPGTIAYGSKRCNCYLVKKRGKEKFGVIYATDKCNGYPVSTEFLSGKVGQATIDEIGAHLARQ